MLALLGHVPKQYHNTMSQDHSKHLGSAPEFIKTRRMGESAAVIFGSDQSFKTSKARSAEERAFCVLSQNMPRLFLNHPMLGPALLYQSLCSRIPSSEHFNMKASFYSAFVLLMCFHNDTPLNSICTVYDTSSFTPVSNSPLRIPNITK